MSGRCRQYTPCEAFCQMLLRVSEKKDGCDASCVQCARMRTDRLLLCGAVVRALGRWQTLCAAIGVRGFRAGFGEAGMRTPRDFPRVVRRDQSCARMQDSSRSFMTASVFAEWRREMCCCVPQCRAPRGKPVSLRSGVGAVPPMTRTDLAVWGKTPVRRLLNRRPGGRTRRHRRELIWL